MDARLNVPDLKRKLLEEVRGLFHRNGSVWKEPILDLLQDLRRADVQAVLFGGTLRSIVATDVGEVATALAQGEAGMLVEPGNAAALASALDRMLSNPKHASEFGRRAAARALAEYDISHMVRKYVETYQELLGESAAAEPRRSRQVA